MIKKRASNLFNISYGNLEVLKLIPEMMNDLEFRQKLRSLTLDFMMKKQRFSYKGEQSK